MVGRAGCGSDSVAFIYCKGIILDIEELRKRIRNKHYLIKSHAVQHALKEGFARQHIVAAVLTGEIIETYPDDQRVLISGSVVMDDTNVYLHVVCEYVDPVYVDIIIAYIPDLTRWDNPPLRRRRQRR